MHAIIKATTILTLCLVVSCGIDRPSKTFRKPPSAIIDTADILSDAQEDSISQVIKKLSADIGSEIAVLTIDSLGMKNLEEFSLQMADSLRLGRSTHDDGILITVSFFDRKARIEVGTGLENIIRDEVAAEMLREDLAPKFREENYGLGIYIVVARVSKLIRDNEKLVGSKPTWK